MDVGFGGRRRSASAMSVSGGGERQLQRYAKRSDERERGEERECARRRENEAAGADLRRAVQVVERRRGEEATERGAGGARGGRRWLVVGERNRGERERMNLGFSLFFF